jgi:hypothetical protein
LQRFSRMHLLIKSTLTYIPWSKNSKILKFIYAKLSDKSLAGNSRNQINTWYWSYNCRRSEGMGIRPMSSIVKVHFLPLTECCGLAREYLADFTCSNITCSIFVCTIFSDIFESLRVWGLKIRKVILYLNQRMFYMRLAEGDRGRLCNKKPAANLKST